MGLKVAILGTVSLHRGLAPFDDASWDIWVCSPGNHGDGVIPRVTRWYELHGTVDMLAPENKAWAGPYFAWLKKQSCEIWMQEPIDEIPDAKIFPIKALLREFGDLGRIAFTSSIAMMTAHAIVQGAEEIALYGVDMAATEEAYTGQKPGCQIMMAIAKQRGIKVHVPLESCLGQFPPLYGYAEATRFGRRMLVKEQEMERDIANYNATIDRLTRERLQAVGAHEAFKYVRRTFVDGADAELDLPAPDHVAVPVVERGTFSLNKESGVLVPASVNGGYVVVDADDQKAASKKRRQPEAEA